MSPHKRNGFKKNRPIPRVSSSIFKSQVRPTLERVMSKTTPEKPAGSFKRGFYSCSTQAENNHKRDDLDPGSSQAMILS